MSGDDLPDNGESEAGSVPLGGGEEVKNINARLNANAGILDFQNEVLPGVFAMNGQSPALWHRFEGILEEVQQNLF
jgi:hypothetical protein